MNPRRIDRAEYARLLRERKLTRATLYERHDYVVDLGPGSSRFPVRDVTNEREHWHRAIKPVGLGALTTSRPTVNTNVQRDVEHQIRKAIKRGDVFDPFARSPDAEFILEPEEARDNRWVLIRAPIEWFNDVGEYGGGQWNAKTWASKVESDPREMARVHVIQKGIRDRFGGDVLAALTHYPLLATDTGYLLDGWHRLYVWNRWPPDRLGPPTLVSVPRTVRRA